MKKKWIPFFGLILLLCYACKGNTVQTIKDDVSLQELKVDGKSVLDKLDNNLVSSEVETKKYTVPLVVRAKNKDVVDINVTTNDIETKGRYPRYTCRLVDGNNEIKITSTSKKDSSNKKTYTVKINKSSLGVPDESSSKLKELKVDGKSIINDLNSKNIATLSDVGEAKEKVKVYVLAWNTDATITVSNDGQHFNELNSNIYEVDLDFGLNEICVDVDSTTEGLKRHIIRIYKKEDLTLKSFEVDGKEYCENGKIKPSSIKFDSEKSEAIVKVKPTSSQATILLKHNEKEIKAENGSYKINLELGKNAIEVIVKGRGGIRSESYKVVFRRASPPGDVASLLKLKADGKDILHLLSKDNSITLTPCENAKSSLLVEAMAESGITIKVSNNGSEVSGSGSYNVPLVEGNNNITVSLYKGSKPVGVYSIFIIRYPIEDVPNSPSSDEVQLTIVISDGVNGSSVDGSYVNILKTNKDELVKRVLVINGKAKVNLTKNNFYDFKVEGRNTDYSQTRYAASNVISYYVSEKTKTLPIVQFPLQRITRPAQAPLIKEFKFDGKILATGDITNIERMKNIDFKIESASPIEELPRNSPYPRIGVGYVPVGGVTRYKDFTYATQSGDTKKNAQGKYESSWSWTPPYNMSLVKGEEFDVILVLYDLANNRLEYHARFKTSNKVEEDSSITVSDFKMQFKSYPTPSRLFSVGDDSFTKNSSHYENLLRFKVKKGSGHVSCKGFDLYRKCVGEEDDFRLIKHFVYDSPKASSSSGNYQYHMLQDNDGVLEEEKTYFYKIVAYTSNDKKSKLEASPMIELKVPKSTSIVLDYPVNVAITKTQANSMDYVLKLSNPKILDTAKEIRLGFLISHRQGKVIYASKFKYVFDDSDGKDEIYFAEKNDIQSTGGDYTGTDYSIKRNTITNKKVEELIEIDKSTGTIKLTKDFFSLDTLNLAAYSLGKLIGKYKEGEAYYWDIVDWGASEYTDYDDRACMIISKESNGAIIISYTNDENNGSNAWNGRAEFTIRAD